MNISNFVIKYNAARKKTIWKSNEGAMFKLKSLVSLLLKNMVFDHQY